MELESGPSNQGTFGSLDDSYDDSESGHEDPNNCESDTESVESTDTVDRSLNIQRPVQFRLGTRSITATGTLADHSHPNVLRLCIQASVIQSILAWLHSWLPRRLRTWFTSSFPEWFLPTQIILKRKKKGWDGEFDNEIANYETIKSLQGVLIPVCYGQTEYRGERALVLSDIGGACVAEAEGAILHEKVMRGLFEQALRPLAELGITHDDVKLDNFHLVEKEGGQKAIMVVDLERLNQLGREDAIAHMMWDVDSLVEAYRDHLICLKSDGLLIGKLKDLMEPVKVQPVVNEPVKKSMFADVRGRGMFSGKGNLPRPPPPPPPPPPTTF